MGAAKQVKLLSVKVTDSCSATWQGSTAITAVDWLTVNAGRPAVVNISLQAKTTNTSLDVAVANSIASGLTYVVAAGNHGTDSTAGGDACEFTPARVASAITVAASDVLDRRWTGSNYGSCLDMFAPGVNVISAVIAYDAAYQTADGTSQAAPLAAGVAAMYLPLAIRQGQ